MVTSISSLMMKIKSPNRQMWLLWPNLAFIMLKLLKNPDLRWVPKKKFSSKCLHKWGMFNFIFLHSMEKKSTKVGFSPISCKKAPFYIVNCTFKGMLLLSYLASLDNKPRTCLLKSISRYRNNYYYICMNNKNTL